MFSLRRHLVFGIQLTSSVLATAAGLAPSLDPRDGDSQSYSSCKAVPGTPGWPSPQDWAELNESLAGRLLQPPPPGAVCHPGQPTYDAAACPAVREGWSTYDYHQADPISVDWNQWTNDSCLPYDGAPCSRQGYPVYVINATEARHVQLGVQFAQKHNTRLIVKSSGHDYMGRSNAPNSLSIWVHHLREVKTHDDSFRPNGCKVTIDGAAVTVGGGMQMWDLYSALDPLNQTVVGGGAKSVSVGGYVTGGGHGLLSSKYGLAADRVLEMEVVTPKGEVVIANECQNKDLFWAMRGGGGSTFGILTSVTLQTVPTPIVEQLTFGILTTNITDQQPIFDMLAYLYSQFPSMGDRGLTGYSYYFGAAPNPLDGGATLAGGMYMLSSMLDASPEDMQAVWAPVLDHINATWPGRFWALGVPKTFPSFLEWYAENYDASAAGLNTYLGSRLLDREALTGDLTKAARAWEGFAGGSVGTAYLVSGKGVHNARPRGCGNAVVPAWRRAYVHATFGIDSPPLNQTATAAVQDQVTKRVAALRELAPDMGAYVNEADVRQPDWQHEFWGSNYERLHRIKRAVDPDDVLWCHPCVGNERWELVDDRLCRVR